MRDEPLCSRCKSPVLQPRVDISSEAINTRLRSEFGSSSSRTQDISELLALCDKDMDDYGVCAARLRSQILYIQRQQDRLMDHKRKVQSLLSPTRKLPSEILSCIFNDACSQNVLQEFPWPLAEMSPPTTLSSPVMSYLPVMSISAVCMRWRSLALSTPSLWSRLRLEIASAPVTSRTSTDFVSLVQLFLDRSQQDPLMLELDITGHMQPSDPIVLTTIVQNSRRWKTFRFTGDLEVSEVPSFSQLYLAKLEDLSIDVRRAAPTAADIVCFEQSPRLHSLTTDTLVSPPSMLWERLSSVHICADYGQIDKILTFCPNVSNLTLWEYFKEVPLSTCTPPRTSNTITSIAIEVSDSGKDVLLLDTFLNSFTLPFLREFHISNLRPKVPYRRAWPKRAFKDFITRSSCKIEILSISRVGLADKDLVDCLQLLPSLRKLFINDEVVLKGTTPITTRLIASLCASGQSDLMVFGSPLIPRLQDLTLDSEGADVDDQALVRMVSTRWLPDSNYANIVGISSLREVVVKFRGRKMDPGAYSTLQDLDKMGLRVVVT